MPLHLHRLAPHDEPGFRELLALYEAAFPASERKPTATLRAALGNRHSHLLLAQEQGSTVGFAIAQQLSTAAALFEYMAIHPAHRNRGLGHAITHAVLTQLAPPPAILLLEVESDRVPHPDQPLRARRKRFYREQGARELAGLRWLMPPQGPELPPALDMLVMGHTAPTITRDRLRQHLTAVYTEVYAQNAEDPRIESMLAGLPAEVPLL